jgi:hypothetical protein
MPNEFLVGWASATRRQLPDWPSINVEVELNQVMICGSILPSWRNRIGFGRWSVVRNRNHGSLWLAAKALISAVHSYSKHFPSRLSATAFPSQMIRCPSRVTCDVTIGNEAPVTSWTPGSVAGFHLLSTNKKF